MTHPAPRPTAISRLNRLATNPAEKCGLASLPLLHDGQAGTFDFALLDADKTEYVEYYGGVLRLLRTGGLSAVDNTLWNGDVIDSENARDGAAAIRVFNRKLLGDERASLSLVLIGDGLTLARKRG